MTFPASTAGFWPRFRDAMRRRWDAARAFLRRHDARSPAERALDWLLTREVRGGLRPDRATLEPCPATTAAAAGMAFAYGMYDLAKHWGQWLTQVVRDDGSLPPAVAGSLVNTAHAVRAWILLEPIVPDVTEHAQAACDYLHRRLEQEGMTAFDDYVRGYYRPLGTVETACLLCVATLVQAARHWNCEEWELTASRAIRWSSDLRQKHVKEAVPLEAIAWELQLLDELGLDVAALEAARRLERTQRPNGSIPNLYKLLSVSSAGLAQVAAHWYRSGRREAADRAMGWLLQRQRRTGEIANSPTRGCALAAVHFLDAARLQVLASFDETAESFPDDIDPEDGRMQAVRRWVESLGPAARVIDVGCGKGRFLRRLAPMFSKAEFTGVDVSASMLASVPQGIAAFQGSLLAVPVPDGAYDGAMAIESLEHALFPERAAAELCRVIRPGGKVIIIDKHHPKKRLSHHDPWERWFTPDELRRWLEPHCEDVVVEFVSHLEGRPGNDLFLAATATKR